MRGGSLYCCKYFNGKLITKRFLTIFEIIYYQHKLRLCLRVKGVPHQLNLSQISSKTSSVGTGFTPPDLIS